LFIADLWACGLVLKRPHEKKGLIQGDTESIERTELYIDTSSIFCYLECVGLWVVCKIGQCFFQNLLITGLWACGLIQNSVIGEKECVIQGDTESIELL
jgi:hypothetical protein